MTDKESLLKMHSMSQIVKKLVGNIEPVGCTATDEDSLDNLKEMIDVTHTLIDAIYDVSKTPCNGEASIEDAIRVAKGFLKEVGEDYCDDR